MRFDWYQASVPEIRPEVLQETLAKSDYYGDWEQSRAGKGYDSGAQFIVGGEVLYRMSFGGRNEQYGPNVMASGAAAQKLADLLREHHPAHKVSRMDSCEDYHHKDVYRYLRKKALKIAREQKVHAREITKPLKESDDGRTLYIGSESSAVQLRLYEKGKQLGCGNEWVRAECQVRPTKALKVIAAHLSPLETWAIAQWSHEFAKQLGHEDLQRVDAKIYQPSDHERAYRFMIKQYAKVLNAMKASHGSWEAVGAQIGYDLEHSDDQLEKIVLKPSNAVSGSDWENLARKFKES